MSEAPETEAPEALPALDARALIAKLRGSTDAVRMAALLDEAYRRTFAGELGRFVLAHHLMQCGVGRQFGRDATDQDLRYLAGMHDSAIDLAAQAGYDQAALATAVLTDTLEEETPYDRSSDWLLSPGDDV